MRYNLVCTTNTGVEDVAAREIEEKTGRKAEFLRKGKIIVRDCTEDEIFKINLCSQSVHRVMILLKRENVQSLDDIYNVVKNVDYTEYIWPTQSFAIRPQRVGEHDFTSIDIGRVAGQAVIDSFKESKGVRLKVNLDEPHVIIRAELYDNDFFLMLDTSGERSLHKRGYRVYRHRAPIKSTLAYSLVRLSGWKFDESLVDPMCGGGTIPIEAAIYCRNILPSKLRVKEFAFWKLFFLNREKPFKIMEEYRERDVKPRIEGFDINVTAVDGAFRNAHAMGVDKYIKFYHGDATRNKLDYDVIITNPPYGVRIDLRFKEVKALYKRFAENLWRSNWRRLVVITCRAKLLRDALGIAPIDERVIEHGSVTAKVLIFEK